MSGLLIIIGALCSLGALIFTLSQWWSARQAVDQAKRREVAFTIPLLGDRQSGKTALLAGLGQQFDQEISALIADEPFSVRLLSHVREERVRGRTLTRVDLKSDEVQTTQSELSQPGRRSTQAMIASGRAPFEGERSPGDVGELAETHDREDAYFSSHFSDTSSEEYLWRITDVPGDHFTDEQSYESNLYPVLNGADGLIITLDGALISAQSEHRSSDYVRYQHLVERFTHLSDEGSIWIVVTKADRITSDDGRDAEAWRELIFSSLIPALRLLNPERVHVSLTSATTSDEDGWSALGALGVDLLRGLTKIARQRDVTQREHQLTATRRGRWSLVSALASLIFGWMSWGVYEHQRLPSLVGEIEWDWDSLETASAPYLRERAHLDDTSSPIRLYRAEVLGGLATLRSAYLDLFTREFSRWAQEISSAKLEAERARAEQRLERSKTALKRFHQALTRWEQLNLKERALLSRVDEARESMRAWRALEKRPRSLEESFSLLTRYKLGSWAQRCAAQKVVACALKAWFERAQVQLLEHTLTLAQSQSELQSARLIQARHNLEPLLLWRAAYDQVRPNLSSDELQSELTQRSHALIERAWERAWSQLQHQLQVSQAPRSWRRALSQLRALRAFEEQRRALEEKHRSSLPMPSLIAKAWRDQVNIACVQISDDLQTPDRTLGEAMRRELTDLVSWAQVFLDAKRAARVKLREREQRWLSELRASFKATQVAPLDQCILMIERELSELSAVEGRLEIDAELKVWRARLSELQAWRAPHKVTLHVSELTCDSEAFEEHNIKIDGLSIWDDDLIEYYLVIHSEGEPVATWFGDADQPLTFQWSPWMSVSVSVLDQDGKIDHLTQGDDRESDDDQVGQSAPLGSRYHLPQGATTLNVEGVCSAQVKSTDPTPAWLSALSLLDEKLEKKIQDHPQGAAEVQSQDTSKAASESGSKGVVTPKDQPKDQPKSK